MIEAQPRLVDTGRGYTIVYRGRYLYSSRAPRQAALDRQQRVPLAPNTLFFIPGLGLGYGLAELLQKLPQRCHVLCIEADEQLLRLALDSGQHLPQDERLTIIRTDQPGKAAAVLHSLGLWQFRRLVPVYLSGCYLLFKEQYREIQAALEEEIRLFWQNKLTLMVMSRLWLKNLFANLALVPAAEDITRLTTDRPVLVAGAGPSLDKTLNRIRTIRDQVILLAVDTSLPALAAAGMRPDWVFTLEAQISNLQDFLPYRDPRLKVLGDLTANPQSLRLFPELFFFASRFYPLRLFDRLQASALLPTAFSPRGSVGVAAVEAALLLTDAPVLITGLDFSYPNGQTHTRGAPSQLLGKTTCSRLLPCGMKEFQALLERPRLWLSGKAGKRILTDLVLRSYALQLQGIVKDSGRVFDLGQEGLATGAPVVHSEAELARILRDAAVGKPPCSARPERRNAAGSLSGKDPAAVREKTVTFCRGEQELLGKAAETIGRLASRDAPPAVDELPEELREVEYLFLPAAAADPRDLFSPVNLRAASVVGSELASVLERTSAALSAGL